MVRAWPLLALLALAAAWWGNSEALRRTPRAASAPAEATPTTQPKAAQDAAVVVANTGTQAAPENEPIVAPKPPEQTSNPSGQSLVSVNAKPWAEVLVDGRSVGTTPLRKLKLRAGVHSLTLRCPPLGREAALKLEFSPAQSARVVVDLSVSPARTFLDGVREAR
jgi:hypothetical protein